MSTFLTVPASALPNLAMSQIADIWAANDRHAHLSAPGSLAKSRAMWRRERAQAEADLRGFRCAHSWSGTGGEFMTHAQNSEWFDALMARPDGWELWAAECRAMHAGWRAA